jgi:hypothetical protein
MTPDFDPIQFLHNSAWDAIREIFNLDDHGNEN